MPSISPLSDPAGTPIEGRLFDGTSARVRPVTIERIGGVLRLTGPDGAEEVDEALLARDVAEGRILLHRSDLPDWRLAIASVHAPAFADLPGRHRMTPRGWRWLGGSVAGVLLVAALLLLFGNLLLVRLAPLVPRRIAAGVGVPFADMMADGSHGCHAPAGEAALGRLVARMAPRGGFVEPVRVRVSREGGVNAFTLPGGEVVVLSGLIDAAESPDELGGVLAHEFGHVQRRHPAQALLRHFGLDLFVSGVGGNVGSAAMTGLFLRNSRAAERQADGEALAMLRDAGVSPLGLAAFFARVGKERKDDGALDRLATLAATHPSDGSRQSRFRAAAVYAATPALSPEEWHALKAICARGAS